MDVVPNVRCKPPPLPDHYFMQKLVIRARVPGKNPPLYFSTAKTFNFNHDRAKEFESEDPQELETARGVLQDKFKDPAYAASTCWKGYPFEQITVEFAWVKNLRPAMA